MSAIQQTEVLKLMEDSNIQLKGPLYLNVFDLTQKNCFC